MIKHPEINHQTRRQRTGWKITSNRQSTSRSETPRPVHRVTAELQGMTGNRGIRGICDDGPGNQSGHVAEISSSSPRLHARGNSQGRFTFANDSAATGPIVHVVRQELESRGFHKTEFLLAQWFDRFQLRVKDLQIGIRCILTLLLPRGDPSLQLGLVRVEG